MLCIEMNSDLELELKDLMKELIIQKREIFRHLTSKVISKLEEVMFLILMNKREKERRERQERRPRRLNCIMIQLLNH